MFYKIASILIFTSSFAFGADLTNAAWIAGCWQQGTEPGSVEQWMKPAGGMMMGMSRTVANSKVREYEFMMIQKQDDGNVYYVAKPSGQPEASFKLINNSATELIFENPAHDFPQRIIYKQSGKDSLIARIEGVNQGKQQGFDYPMKRVSCE
jgi:hypothetical protein